MDKPSKTTSHIPCPTTLHRMYSKQAGKRRAAQRRVSGESSTNARSPQRARAWRRIDSESSDHDSDINTETDPDPYTDHDHDEGPSSERLAKGKWSTRKHARFIWKPTSPLLPRKRTLSEALSESISPALKKAKTKTDLQSLQHMARSIPRCIGPFTNIHSTFLTGSELDAEIKRDPGRLDTLDIEHKTILDLYHKILEAVPGLSKLVEWASTEPPQTLVALASLLDHSGGKGRTDDCGSVRNNGLKYIPYVDGYPKVGFAAKKKERGFYHPATARLLCPRHLREQFDRNPENFCHDVHYGNIFISHDDWPSFLYPEEEYNPEALDENLLRGPFLLSCFRHIFTGPRTAQKKSPGKSPGKKSKADLYNITKVTPENIAYAAILCRHILNSKESWATQDGGFHADVFYANIVDLFDDKEWAQDTLNWWNKWVFGDDPRVQDNLPSQCRERGFFLLAAQRAARRRNAGVRDSVSSSELKEE